MPLSLKKVGEQRAETNYWKKTLQPNWVGPALLEFNCNFTNVRDKSKITTVLAIFSLYNNNCFVVAVPSSYSS